MNVLHIAAHLGGGVGTAFCGILNESRKQGTDVAHSFLLMEEPVDALIIRKLKSLDAQIYIYQSKSEAKELLIAADIVSIEWWHHPSVYSFLITFEDIPCRAVIWSHVSGCSYPYLNVKLLELYDKLLLTTPYSYESHDMASLGIKCLEEKVEVVYGLGDYSKFLNVKKETHSKFNIGYIGTVNFAKINPNIERYCNAVDIDDVVFTFVGKDDISGTISNQSLLANMVFTGYTDEPWRHMARFDVFGYLLSPSHYGTTENALLEAMAAGVVPVALNQNVEKHIIEDGVNGFLVDSPERYGKVIRYLYEHPDICNSMGERARESVLNRFDISKNTSKLHDVYLKVSSMPKLKRPFAEAFGKDAYDWFLFGMDDINQVKMNAILEQRNPGPVIRSLPEIFFQKKKSSVFHFCEYYPHCERLAEIVRIFKGEGENNA